MSTVPRADTGDATATGSTANPGDRRTFIGGSDARTIKGNDEAVLQRLWREKRGKIEPEDLTDNLMVQLSSVTEEFNRRWYQKTSMSISRGSKPRFHQQRPKHRIVDRATKMAVHPMSETGQSRHRLLTLGAENASVSAIGRRTSR